MCLPFSFQGRVKVSVKITVRKIEVFRKCSDIWGHLENFGGIFRGTVKNENFRIDF